MAVLGIDLGTTFSCVAIYQNGSTKVLKNARDCDTTPSVVVFDPDRPSPLVGQLAVNNMQSFPKRTVRWIKRQMSNPNPEPIIIDGKNYTPEMVSSIILKHLVKEANERLKSRTGEETKDVVITVPAYFSDLARKRTMEAGKLAGLNVLALHNEPTAAAMSYLQEHQCSKDTTYMVYDLGGGTFDVSFVKVNGKELEVVATGGNHKLGGYDFDMVLYNMILNECEYEGDPQELLHTEDGMGLLGDVVNLKIDLSEDESVPFTLPYFLRKPEKGEVRILREDFEIATTKLLLKTKAEITATAKKSDQTIFYNPHRKEKHLLVDKVLLVGGSSRMPMVKKMIVNDFKMNPNDVVVHNPDRCVAEGAALYALDPAFNQTSQHSQMSQKDVITVINQPGSHSYGIRVNKNGQSVVANLIKNTDNLVMENSFTNKFATDQDNLKEILICIYENESKDSFVPLDSCTNINKDSYMKLQNPVQKNTPIDVYIQRDINGMVRMQLKCNGEEQEIRFNE